MRYELKAYLIHDIGKRANQEDAHYPPFIEARHFDKVEREEAYYEGVPHTDCSLFILCDGMGGHERGEVASHLVCDVMSKYLTEAEKAGKRFDRELLHQAVEKSFVALDDNDDSRDKRKMGTTMTLLKIHERGATIGHIGDSRVYHFRPSHGKRKAMKLFRTEDHSLVNDMLRSGALTIQQARNYPQRSVLTKAMQAGLQTHLMADVYETKDIMPGDVFFLCTDGMLEEIYDKDLCKMLTNPHYTDEQRVQILLSFCKDNRDNHTAWIVRVEKVEDDNGNVVCFEKEEKEEGLWEKATEWIKRLTGK